MSNKRPIAVRGFRLPSFLASEEVPAEGACADGLLEESLLALDVASSSGSFPAPATFAISVLGSSSATDMEQMSDGGTVFHCGPWVPFQLSSLLRWNRSQSSRVTEHISRLS